MNSETQTRLTIPEARSLPSPGRQVLVPAADADLLRKVHRILKSGRNVEIRRDTSGVPKVFRVSREIEK